MQDEAASHLATALQLRRLSAVSALICLVWETAIILSEEKRSIWRRPLTFVKFLSIFSRFSTLTSQSAYCAFIFMLASRRAFRHDVCTWWYSFHVVATQIQLWVVDLILLLRLYAMYNTNRLATGLLFALFTGDIIVGTCIAYFIVYSAEFDHWCMPASIPFSVIYLALNVFSQQIIIWTLTLLSRAQIGRSSALMKLVIRDGAWACGVVCALFAFFIPYYMMIPEMAYAVATWPVVILSIGACRLILNMQQLREDRMVDGSIEFTSHMSIQIPTQTSDRSRQ